MRPEKGIHEPEWERARIALVLYCVCQIRIFVPQLSPYGCLSCLNECVCVMHRLYGPQREMSSLLSLSNRIRWRIFYSRTFFVSLLLFFASHRVFIFIAILHSTTEKRCERINGECWCVAIYFSSPFVVSVFGLDDADFVVRVFRCWFLVFMPVTKVNYERLDVCF